MNEPMTASDDLLERLVARDLVDNGHGGGKHIARNPDGPEAKARIEALEAVRDELRAMVTTLSATVGNREAQRDEAVKALERLASMEAFDTARSVHPVRDAELTARITFAETTLASIKGKNQ